MKKYELTYRTIMETEKHMQITDESTNELIHKIKLALIGNDESNIDEYAIDIEFNNYGSIDLDTALSLIYDEIIIKRSSLFDYIKNTYDTIDVTFRSDKIKYLDDDYVCVDISFNPFILEQELNENIKREFLFNIFVSLLDDKPLIDICIRRKSN